MSVSSEITRLSDRRAAIWAGAPESDSHEVDRISKRLAELYEERRHEQARGSAGAGRREIQKRARVESELERLMSKRG